MKHVRERFKAYWKIITGIIAWAALVAVIFFQSGISLSERIQAASIITLVFITWFYAVQTQRLVNEERKKRNAEFGVRRIKEFLYPLLNKLESLKDSVSLVGKAGEFPLRVNFVDPSLTRLDAKKPCNHQ